MCIYIYIYIYITVGRCKPLENATVCGRDWYKLLDAPVLILDVTV